MTFSFDLGPSDAAIGDRPRRAVALPEKEQIDRMNYPASH
jgi:hypothetical protein